MADTQLGIVLRPTTFDEVIGQEDTVKVMRSLLDKGEVPRAVLFVGPAGVGKTTLGKIFARAAQGWEFPADSEPDLIEINAADMTGIDDIRALIDDTQSYPMIGKYRVIILDEAHQLSKPAQNCLLKPFEDPNSRNLWIICTTETAKIIPALVTRCQRFDLKRLTKKGIHDVLVVAAKHTGTEDFAAFETLAIKENLNQPRPLLNAFGNYANGMPALDAINAQLGTHSADAFSIAQAVVYGDWDKPMHIWNGKVETKPVKDLFKALEAEIKRLKKQSAPNAEADTDAEVIGLEDEAKDDAISRPEVSRTIRAIVGGFLKAEVIKGSTVAAHLMDFLAHTAPPSPFDAALEYPATVAACMRINKKLRETK